MNKGNFLSRDFRHIGAPQKPTVLRLVWFFIYAALFYAALIYGAFFLGD
jgi:hypothetical protein